MAEKEDVFVIQIILDKEQATYKAKGSMTSGNVKMMIGGLELIKARLLSDLEASLDNVEPTDEYEFEQ